MQCFMQVDQDMLRCGQTDVYIKPECVCSFYNVYEAKYHGYSSCPDGAGSDIVTQLKCRHLLGLYFISRELKYLILFPLVPLVYLCISLQLFFS